MEAAPFEVEVFDSEIERLTDPQAAGVDQMHNQAGGIAVNIGHVGQARTPWNISTKDEETVETVQERQQACTPR